jgi:hypothetical protein
MKSLYLLLPALLLFGAAGAQTQPAKTSGTSKTSKNYLILSLSPGILLPAHPGHDVTATFPYSTTSTVTGSVSQQTFSGSLHGKFTSPALMEGLNVEFGEKHLGFDIGFGLFQEEGGAHGSWLQAGYRYTFHLGGLQLKPGVDVYYFIDNEKLGSIDNKKKTIDLLGATVNDHFTALDDDGAGDGGTVENTYDADRLNVNYQRTNWMVTPKLILATNPVRKLIFSLETGWMIQVKQNSGLQLEQVNDSSKESAVAATVGMDRNGSMGGPYAAASIGLYFK